MLEIGSVYDSGEQFADRYSIEFVDGDTVVGYLNVGDQGNWPNAFCQWGEDGPSDQAREISFDSLPEPTKRAAYAELDLQTEIREEG